MISDTNLQNHSKILEQRQAYFYRAQTNFYVFYRDYAIDYSNEWEWLKAEHNNLLAAIQNCRDNEILGDLLSFRDALQPYFDLQGHWEHSLKINEWAVEIASELDDQLSVARFTHDRADIFHQIGHYQEAKTLYHKSEDIYFSLDEKFMAIQSRHMRTLVIRAQGNLREAEELCEAVINQAKELSTDTWIAHPLYVRALLARDHGNFRQARQSIEDALQHLSQTDETAMIAQCYHFLGELAFLGGDLVTARSHLQKSLELSQLVGILRRVSATQRILGDVTHIEGHYIEAKELYRKAYDLAVELGDQPQQARVLLSQAQLQVTLKEYDKAITLLKNTLTLYQDIGDPRHIAAASLLLTRLYFRQGRVPLALQQTIYIVKILYQAKLLQPKLLIGLWRRRGK